MLTGAFPSSVERKAMNDSHPPRSKRRWYHLSPDRFIIGLLAVEGLSLLSERFQWFTSRRGRVITVLGCSAFSGHVSR